MLGAAGSANAAYTIGQTAGATDGCGSGQALIQAQIAGPPSYVASTPGVIVSWSYLAHSQAPSIKLKVYRATAAAQSWFLRSESSVKPPGGGPGQVQTNHLNTFSESPGLRIQAGDTLGLTGTGAFGIACIDTLSTADVLRTKAVPPDTLPGQDNSGFVGTLAKLRIGVSAVVEPDADGDSFGDQSQDSCPTDTGVHTGPCPADVSIVKTASANPRVGSNLGYGLVVRNNHPTNPATGVNVVDVLPAGATFVASATGKGSCAGTTTVTCALGTLSAGQSVNVGIVVRPTATGPLSNTASVSTASSDTSSANNSSTAAVTVGPAIPVLSQFKLKPSSFVAATSGPSVRAAAIGAGVFIGYKINAPATTKFTVQKVAPGVRKGKKCVAPPKTTPKKKPKKCTRYLSRGSFTHKDAPGSVKFRFTGRVKGKTLKPGSYRVRAVARNVSGVSKAVTKRFKVKKG
jgi:uncharacterized repeat protein (TIGR01451 family)